MIKHTRYISIITDRGASYILPNSWIFKLLGGYRNPPFNKGAGYIGGFTFYLGWNLVDNLSMYKPRKKFYIGVTRNHNHVPWTRH